MGLNWRSPLLFGAMRATRSPIPGELRLIRSLERAAPERLREVHDQRLAALLLHAWQHTDYYREVLGDCGAVRDGVVHLDRFEAIPFLTRDILHREGERLRARTVPAGRTSFRNSSGGSVGQPVAFWQDSHYWRMNIAAKLYRAEVLGKRLGEPELKIWGSERDLTEGTIGLAAKAQNFLYNRHFEQCFQLSEERVREIVDRVNTVRPRLIWAYRDGIDRVATYVNRHGLRVHSPAAVVCGGATLYPHIAESIRTAFGTPVIDHYGSREVGDVACQCLEQGGRHIAAWARRVETIDAGGAPVIEREGELVVTVLNNYTMPFIRYRIGDRGALTAERCPCGRTFPLLASLGGRVVEVFVTAGGETVDPIYFVYLMRTVYDDGAVQRFQVVQEDYDRIRIRIVPGSEAGEDGVRARLDQVRHKVRRVMGAQCAVTVEFVSDLPLTPQGKHRYVVREIAPERLDPRLEARVAGVSRA